jgi:hypothetical protein
MHLGLINGPYVPHNLILAQRSPVPLLKFQMAPRLKFLMSSGSKKKEPRYAFSFHFFFLLSKVPVNETPPGSPMERATHLQGLFTYLTNSHKNSPK